MLEAPAVAYDGGVSGLPATKPGKGNKINPAADNVKNYRAYLKGRTQQGPCKTSAAARSPTTTTASPSTASQRSCRTRRPSRCASRRASSARSRPTSSNPSTPSTTLLFLGLTAKGGLWDQLRRRLEGRPEQDAEEDVIIGVINSSIKPQSRWAHSAASSTVSNGKVYQHKVTGFHGELPRPGSSSQPLTATSSSSRPGTSTTGGAATPGSRRCAWESQSARDYNGHGTTPPRPQAATRASR